MHTLRLEGRLHSSEKVAVPRWSAPAAASRRPDLTPQILMVDGMGVLHPRGLGLASHLGVLTGIPTIGVGKTCPGPSSGDRARDFEPLSGLG